MCTKMLILGCQCWNQNCWIHSLCWPTSWIHARRQWKKLCGWVWWQLSQAASSQGSLLCQPPSSVHMGHLWRHLPGQSSSAEWSFGGRPQQWMGLLCGWQDQLHHQWGHSGLQCRIPRSCCWTEGFSLWYFLNLSLYYTFLWKIYLWHICIFLRFGWIESLYSSFTMLQNFFWFDHKLITLHLQLCINLEIQGK